MSGSRLPLTYRVLPAHTAVDVPLGSVKPLGGGTSRRDCAAAGSETISATATRPRCLIGIHFSCLLVGRCAASAMNMSLRQRARATANGGRAVHAPVVRTHGGSAEPTRGLEREPRQCCQAVSAAL